MVDVLSRFLARHHVSTNMGYIYKMASRGSLSLTEFAPQSHCTSHAKHVQWIMLDVDTYIYVYIYMYIFKY